MSVETKSPWVLVFKEEKEKKERHHLFENHNSYWINFTLYNKSNNTSKRFRFPLKTKDFEKAKIRRDNIFKEIIAKYGITQ